ncbi:MAG: hypothetical protein ACLQAS_07765 [Thermoplasmata archaeon]
MSARGNALSFESELDGPILLRVLNGIAPEVFCSAATPIPEDFRVRKATRRLYRYFEPRAGSDPDRRSRAAALFAGEVDVRSFGRGIPPETPCVRTVESVIVIARDKFLVTEVRAPSFVWGMVRKIVSALREYDTGRISLARLEAAVGGRERLPLPLAEPEGLVLWEVEYPVTWKFRWDGPTRRQQLWALSARTRVRVRSEVLRTLLTDVEVPALDD